MFFRSSEQNHLIALITNALSSTKHKIKYISLLKQIPFRMKGIQHELESNGLLRIYFNEILQRINKKDKRSVSSWCRKNNVEIYNDCSGKFVIEAEFNFAYNQPIIKRYKAKYGENWVQMYELCQENKLHLADSNNERISSSIRYKTKSKAANDFLKKFE